MLSSLIQSCRCLTSTLLALSLAACDAGPRTVLGKDGEPPFSGDGGASLVGLDSMTQGPDAGQDTLDSHTMKPFVESVEDRATVFQERQTPEQIGLYIPLTGGLTAELATVNYRAVGAKNWQRAHPLTKIRPDWSAPGAPVAPVEAFAGSIFDLKPGTTYQVQVELRGEKTHILRRIMSTRSLPGPTAEPTRMATPVDNLQAVFDALAPGDVLELAEGQYKVNNLSLKAAGTKDAPIVVRGVRRQGVVIKDTSRIVLRLEEVSHVIFENLTIEGSSEDSGRDSRSIGVSFSATEIPQEFVTFRQVDFRGVDRGIVAWAPIRSTLVYDCELVGNNLWNEALVNSNLSWNDDALRLPGEGNCGFNNTVRGFGDAFAVHDGVFSAAVYFYRNRVDRSGDDAFEADYATRNIAFYDNYITNAAIFISLDPLWGGPLYCFRNVVINTYRGPLKLNDTNSGFYVYSNTILRTAGRFEWASVQFNNGALRGWAYRNNVLIYTGGQGRLLALESAGGSPIDFTNNAWFPDGQVKWTNSGGSHPSLAEARQGLPATVPVFSGSTRRHDNDILTTRSPFVDAIELGSDSLSAVETNVVPTPKSGSRLQRAGVAIPGITDGYTGPAPTVGAVIAGRAQPSYGARRR